MDRNQILTLIVVIVFIGSMAAVAFMGGSPPQEQETGTDSPLLDNLQTQLDGNKTTVASKYLFTQNAFGKVVGVKNIIKIEVDTDEVDLVSLANSLKSVKGVKDLAAKYERTLGNYAVRFIGEIVISDFVEFNDTVNAIKAELAKTESDIDNMKLTRYVSVMLKDVDMQEIDPVTYTLIDENVTYLFSSERAYDASLPLEYDVNFVAGLALTAKYDGNFSDVAIYEVPFGMDVLLTELPIRTVNNEIKFEMAATDFLHFGLDYNSFMLDLNELSEMIYNVNIPSYEFFDVATITVLSDNNILMDELETVLFSLDANVVDYNNSSIVINDENQIIVTMTTNNGVSANDDVILALRNTIDQYPIKHSISMKPVVVKGVFKLRDENYYAPVKAKFEALERRTKSMMNFFRSAELMLTDTIESNGVTYYNNTGEDGAIFSIEEPENLPKDDQNRSLMKVNIVANTQGALIQSFTTIEPVIEEEEVATGGLFDNIDIESLEVRDQEGNVIRKSADSVEDVVDTNSLVVDENALAVDTNNLTVETVDTNSVDTNSLENVEDINSQ